VGATIQVEP
jgi:hypothetical protein